MEGLGVGMKSAVLVIDIVNDFVSGIFGSENSVAVSGKIATFLKKLEGKAEIVFTLDTPSPMTLSSGYGENTALWGLGVASRWIHSKIF